MRLVIDSPSSRFVQSCTNFSKWHLEPCFFPPPLHFPFSILGLVSIGVEALLPFSPNTHTHGEEERERGGAICSPSSSPKKEMCVCSKKFHVRQSRPTSHRVSPIVKCARSPKRVVLSPHRAGCGQICCFYLFQTAKTLLVMTMSTVYVK